MITSNIQHVTLELITVPKSPKKYEKFCKKPATSDKHKIN